MADSQEYASPACRLHEADPAYADPKFSAEEIRDALIVLRGAIDPARRDVIDGLDGMIVQSDGLGIAAAHADPLTLFDRLLPRVADPALHRELLALRALYALGGPDAPSR